LKLAIIIGTTRQKRETPKQARWVYNAAKQMEGVEPEIIDLKDYPMPFFDEPKSPRYNPNRDIDPIAQKWLKKLEQFDAYFFVTAEYNHSLPAVLKNAIDYITWEIQRKPAAIASHGSAGGARAQIQLKIVLSESRAVPIPIPTPLAMAGMSEKIDEEGNLSEELRQAEHGPQEALENTLAELKWYSDALQVARESKTQKALV
jgi:NAD(P)H-dependent FMN reductase